MTDDDNVTRPHIPRLGGTFDASANLATREKRQELGRQAATAIHSLLRNAMLYGEENAVFTAPVEQLASGIAGLVSTDGKFELLIGADALTVNGQVLKLDAASMPILGYLREELAELEIAGFVAQEPPGVDEVRLLAGLFGPDTPHRLEENGSPERTLKRLRLVLVRRAGRGDKTGARSVDERAAESYAGAAVFVSRYIDGLRAGGHELPPLWAASRTVQDLVDVEGMVPLRLRALAMHKHPGKEYWGFHAANVAVFAIGFARKLGLPRRRRHDLGLAALFHDVGMAALPPALLDKEGGLDERERSALSANPLFAARVVLREREVHPAALERALACTECHLDLSPKDGPPPEIGFCGRVLAICEAFDAMTTARPYREAHAPAEALALLSSNMAFRFDPALVALFEKALA